MLKKQKRLLRQAGFPGGRGLPTFTYETVGGATGRQMDELFVREMAAIGLKVKINANTWPKLMAKVNNKQADMFGMAWSADYPDAENFLALFFGPNESPGVNFSNYQNKAYDRLYNKVRIMSDSPERTVLYKKMAKIIIEDTPMVFNIHRKGFYLKHGWLKYYKPHPNVRYAQALCD